MILQNAGVYRRQAIETVVTSGWTEPVARALGSLLETEKDEAWLRSRAEFALGFLQRPDVWAEAELTSACEHAYERLRMSEIRVTRSCRYHTSPKCTPRYSRSVTALASQVPKNAPEARESGCVPSLKTWRGKTNAPRRAARAAAYLLTVTAQPRSGGQERPFPGTARETEHYPDPVTAKTQQLGAELPVRSRRGRYGHSWPRPSTATHDDSPLWDKNSPT